MTGYWNTCLVLAKVQLSNGLYGRTEHFSEAFQVAALVYLRVGGSMCHTERYFFEKAIYINPSVSFRVIYTHFGVIYQPDVLGTVCKKPCFTENK
jgi:hypothetical protein